MITPVEVLQRMLLGEDGSRDVFGEDASSNLPLSDFFAPEVHHSLFGPSGTKEILAGREAFLDFVSRCAGLLAERRDEIISIVAIDAQCAFVRASAWRKSKATGEEIAYEWAMLYRVEEGLITYGADMLDADAQAFWGRIAG